MPRDSSIPLHAVFIDFDKTIINAHLHNTLSNLGINPEVNQESGVSGVNICKYQPNDPNTVEAKIVNIVLNEKKDFLNHPEQLTTFIKQLMHEGHEVAIATYSQYPSVVMQVLKHILEDDGLLNKIHFVVGIPLDQAQGKEEHINLVLSELKKSNINIDRDNCMLVDDDRKNIKIANNYSNGFTVHVCKIDERNENEDEDGYNVTAYPASLSTTFNRHTTMRKAEAFFNGVFNKYVFENVIPAAIKKNQSVGPDDIIDNDNDDDVEDERFSFNGKQEDYFKDLVEYGHYDVIEKIAIIDSPEALLKYLHEEADAPSYSEMLANTFEDYVNEEDIADAINELLATSPESAAGSDDSENEGPTRKKLKIK